MSRSGYSSATVEVYCATCDAWVAMEQWTEYGTGGFEPEECPECDTRFERSADVREVREDVD